MGRGERLVGPRAEEAPPPSDATTAAPSASAPATPAAPPVAVAVAAQDAPLPPAQASDCGARDCGALESGLAPAARSPTAEGGAPSASLAADGDADGGDECVVCFMPLSDEPTERLECQHQFHAACIKEWLSKDGRCPVCRHICDEAAAAAAAARSARPTVDLPEWAGRQSLLTTQLLLAEGRRLLILASVEAAMSALVMSYSGRRSDLVSPVLMFGTALLLFHAASQFSLRAAALCRPLLAANIFYHVWMCMEIMHYADGDDLFANQNTGLRASVVTVLAVVLLEVVALKSAGIFYARLRLTSEPQLAALRRLRRAQLGLPQKIVLLLLFVLIFAPVLARSLCWAEVGLPDDVCTAEYSTWPPHRPPAENVTTPVNATAGDNSTLTIDGGIGGATNGSLGLEI